MAENVERKLVEKTLETRVEPIYDDSGAHVASVVVHICVPVATSAGLDLRIDTAEGSGCFLVLGGLPDDVNTGSCMEHRVQLAFEVDQDSVRARFRQKSQTLTVSLTVVRDLRDLQIQIHADLRKQEAVCTEGLGDASSAPPHSPLLAPPATSAALRAAAASCEKEEFWTHEYLSSGPPQLLRIEHDKHGVFGRHIVAARSISGTGQLLLLEEPLALLKPGATVLDCPEQSDEWLLTHALLLQGKREQWAQAYVTDKRSVSVENSQAVPWLASRFKCSQTDVLSVFRTVHTRTQTHTQTHTHTRARAHTHTHV
jgi:hypothetical protein